MYAAKRKGEMLLRFGRVKLDMKRGSRWYFTVKGKHEEYSVIIDERKYYESCTCKYWTVRQRRCSHIWAALLYIKQIKSLLRSF